jgi:broad specificity phosphatase PhoE
MRYLLLLALPPILVAPAPPAAPATTIILVRHAEKAAEPALDPPLTPQGEARAKELARVLAKAGLSGVYATKLQRTQLTLRPIADALKLPVTILDAADPDATVKRLLEDHPGKTVLYAGHSDSLPAIIEKLCGAKIEGPGEYDNLYVIVRSADATTYLQLKFGER